ncbi:MAG: nicotinate-nucleotide--dimethylbenzimidazole phosphoribosyltransferase [Chloroflexota bacterium]
MTRLAEAVAAIEGIGAPDADAMAEARRRLDALTKPPGSLGRLEELAIRLAGITGRATPSFDRRTIVVVAADHGVAARGVSAYPPAVTRQMVDNFLAGGAAVSVLSRLVRADLVVVDAGVAGDGARPYGATGSGGARLVAQPIRGGTKDMTLGPAMTRDEAETALDLGLRVAAEVTAVAGIVAVGEMGIGNTTAASAIVAAITGSAAADVTGRGTGVDDEGWRRKVAAVEQALSLNQPDPADPIGVVAAVGGFEIAALAGVILGCVAARVPVVLDGFITGAAALVAAGIAPPVAARLIAAHRSPEPGHRVVLERLGLDPLLDLGLRLGEGSGATLALTLVDAACAIRDDMATFESAGVSGRAST